MKYPYLILYFFLLFIVLSCNPVSSRHMTKINFYPNKVIAHRGAWKAQGLPENSLASLQHSISMHCAGSEFDVHLTQDDSLVIHHDNSFHGLDIETNTYDVLKKISLHNGESIPTLRDYLLKGIKNNGGTRLILEIKPSTINLERGIRIARKVFDMVSGLQASPWITYISFDLEILKTILALDKKAHTQYLNGDLSPASLHALGIHGVDYNYLVFKNHPEWIQEAKENKMVLNVWTVNTVPEMDYFLENKFDFITTNEPELLVEKMKALKN
ncbi:MAG: glycerophosphodiester phosphodiesterase family protein, partial [Saprospiraceae bacterium]